MKGAKITIASTPSVPTVVRGESADSVHWAREAVRTFADSLTPAPDPTTADTLILVVSELATYALRSRRRPVHTRADCHDGRADRGGQRPPPAQPFRVIAHPP